MLEFLHKFNNLPVELREKVSAPGVMQSIGEIEKTYGISLAILIMKVMVKDINVADLDKYFIFEHNLPAEQAKELAVLLKKKIFFDVSDYLGFDKNNISGEKLDIWLQDRKQETAVRGANFYFSTEDEEEVKDLAKKLSGYNPAWLTGDSSEENAGKLIKELNITFSSSDLQNRFRQILKTYLKGVRRKIDIREALIKPVAYGGLEMSDETADKILKQADNIIIAALPAKIIKQPLKIGVPEDLILAAASGADMIGTPAATTAEARPEKLPNANNLVRDVDYDFSQLAALSKKESTAPAEPKLEVNIAAAEAAVKSSPADPAVAASPDITAAQPKPVNYEEIISRAKRIVQEASVDAKSALEPAVKPDLMADEEPAGRFNVISTRRQKNIDGKIRMDDVKYAPKLMGPVDELREMDLVNFRRVNSDPLKTAEKIKEKICFLEDENYSQRLKGIKSWRQSPINKLYLEIGQESIINKKPINVIIDERFAAGRESLSNEEFTAIMELNKELRY